MLRAARRFPIAMAKPTLTPVAAAARTPTHIRTRLVSSSAMPALPVPPLSATLAAYHRSLEPLLSPPELRDSAAAIAAFSASPVAATLQQRLEARRASEVSWLADWWDKVAYDEYRGSVVVNVSYFFVHKHLRAPYDVAKELKVSVQALRAAEIVAAAWAFRNEVASGTLTPEATKDGSLCMESYKYMFHACKYPEKVRDRTVSFAGAEAVESVVVACKHHFFEVPMRHPDNSRDLSVAEIAAQLQFILDNAQKLGSAPGYGILTATDRDAWFINRQRLIALNPELHPHLLHRIEASAFLVALDDASPMTRQELSEACWHGEAANGANRWFDKSLQFIVFKNGRSGFCGEHSRMDGMATLRLNESVCSRIARGDFAATGSVDISLPAPTALDFTAPNASLSASLELARRQFSVLTTSQSLSVIHIPGIGSKRIKTLRASPDAFAQLVIQLAYYHRHGVNRPTYESAQTRKFALGRTETCRVLTSEVAAFCRSMMCMIRQEAAPESGVVPDVNLLAGLARTAMVRQSENMKLAVNAMGIDRHLLGLRMVHDASKDGPLPDMFADPAMAYSKHWFLSTSQLTSEHFDGYGWGEVVEDGYGIAYMIQENTLCFNVTSRAGFGAEEMVKSLDWSAGVVAKLLAEDVDVNRKVIEATAGTIKAKL